MIRTGLTSVTFRHLSPQAIVDLVSRTGLDAIEWGGDIHVPHGDLKAAHEVSRITRDAGLVVSSYGSYYTVGDESSLPFQSVLESAVELGAPCIRVWAGDKGSADADRAYREKIADDSRRIGSMAGDAGLVVAYEFHNDTLTDTNDSTVELLKSVGHSAVKTYWQPPLGSEVTYNVEGLRAVMPWLVNLHTYHWTSGTTLRPLSEGEADWGAYFDVVREDPRDHFALIEFVREDSPESYIEDAAALKSWTG